MFTLICCVNKKKLMRVLCVCAWCFLFVMVLSAQSNNQSGSVNHSTNGALPMPWRFIRDCTPISTTSHDCAFVESMYGHRLRELNELPMLTMPDDKGVLFKYRLTVVSPTSRVTAQIFTLLIKNDHTTDLETKTAGQFSKLISSTLGTLAKNDTEALLSLLDWSTFASTDSINLNDPNRAIKDGQTWLLEGVHGGQYHAVSLWSPTQGSLYDFGHYLLKIKPSNTNQ